MRLELAASDIIALSGVWMQVLHCRRLAAEISDPEISRRLQALADEIERGAREVDMGQELENEE